MSGYSTSPELLWLLTRNSNAGLIKRKQPPALFSREKGNNSNTHSFTASGYIHKDGLSVVPATSGKGVTVTSKADGKTQNIGQSKSTRRLTHAAGERHDLFHTIVDRASKIFHSQKDNIKDARVRAKRGSKAATQA